MKIRKDKTKRILLSLLLCGCMSSSVYAADGDIATLDIGDGGEYTSRTTNSGTTSYNEAWFHDITYSGGSAAALYTWGTITEITDCLFENNHLTSSNNGGAINNYNSSGTEGIIGSISGTTFSGNTAGNYGGAIYSSGGIIGTADAAGNVTGGISNSIFTGNTASASGGAIYNNSGNVIGEITTSTFTSNEATTGYGGGAIYNTGSTIGEITYNTFTSNAAVAGYGGAICNYGSDAYIGTIAHNEFTENSAGIYGGAIYNTGTIDEISYNTFSANYNSGNTSSGGGAIYNDGYIGSIKNNSFDHDLAEDQGNDSGAAIYNQMNGTIGSISDTVFTENEANSNAGALYNRGTIGEITGTLSETDGTVTSTTTFYGNSADFAGAIENTGGSIGSITGVVFDSNSAARDGGVIYNWSEVTGDGTRIGSIGDIKNSVFVDNEGGSYGGAIFNYGYIGLDADGKTTGGISGSTFTGNTSGRGGAIYNGIQRDATGEATVLATIASIDNCYFYQNVADNFGGAIYNYDGGYICNISDNTFEENKAQSGNGGAIENAEANSVIGTIKNNKFLKNDVSMSEHGGGAIYNEGSIDSIGENNFEENTSGNFGGAIYNNGGIIDTDEDGDSISNNTFTGNTSNRGGAIYNTANRSVDDTGAETINPDAPGVITSIDGNTFSGNIANDFGGAIYNYKYGEIKSITGNTFTENAAKGGNGGAIENAESESVIGEISGNTFTKNTAAGGGAAIYNEGTIDSITDNTFQENQAGTYGGAIYNNGGTISEISGDTFTGNSAVSEEGDAAGGAIYNSGTINTFSVKDLSGNYAEGAASAMGGAIYDEGASEITVTGDVTGNYATASSGEAKGGAIYAGEGTVVTLSGNITGNSATGDTAKGGAIYNAGTVNVNVENKDAVISGNTAVSGGTEEANVLYGEAASVTNFNLTDATLRVDDAITGETGFEVNISGNGTDATTFYMYNDINDSNLSIGGTTLNTMNGESHTYNVNKFTVAGDFNMEADIDLKNETMDRFVTNGNSYGTAQGTLNVSALNVVSDTNKTRVGVYFAEPGLKEDVTSSVSDVVGPINTYSVSYDKNYDGSWGDDGGYFVFDKTGTNPAAMMSSVAMAGAYNAMNMMFEYCFEHSDYYMKLPSETRLAIREKAKAARAEKLALKNGTTVEEETQKIDDARAEEMASREGDKFYDHDNVLPLYDQHELTRPGAWVKTFATKESIPFTGKFTAHDKYYGGIIGVDTDFREDKKGWGNVFTGYAGYQGIHQSYSGGSIRQDGGMLGATETFYKKNFYTAWTIAAASTSAKGHNMYGHESSRLYTYGIATKSGWNLEYDGGKYIVLPTFMASYTTVDMRDYTNAAGLRVDADDMRAVQLNPNIKWIRNYNNGWQPYLTAGEVWTVGQKCRVRVNGTKLDELHLRPYTEYGLGVQKRWAHDYDGYAEFLGHAGGRRGFLAKLGFRWTFN